MNKLNIKKDTLLLIIFFIIVNIVVFVLNKQQIGVPLFDYTVVLAGNLLLFVLTFISNLVHMKAVNNNNPYAFVRGIMLMMVVKLLVLATAVILYLYFFRETKNIPSILAGLGLYIIYSIMDVRAAFKLSKKKVNGKN